MTTVREDLLAAIQAADQSFTPRMGALVGPTSDRWLVEFEQALEAHGLRVIRARHHATAAAWGWLEAEAMDDERRARITATLTELDAELRALDASSPEMCPHGLYVWMPCTRCADAEVERLHAEPA